ncbi:GNAT family N-acetyltransferase [Paenibacillus aurantius]|uniref:GNAT family N-acetyltransferase n=1 Tax=Paenibacillus aurantius TaxID=2918900 RepID=A0AA96LA28_9BACL|nr:GNAT family N-acetyltransferase [Paenibacillus aurantius]WNQ09924.1 GNAT family N-acetyltransferase [Paenibacillus aurantius]
MEKTWGDYVISTDKGRLDLEVIPGFLGRSYWAAHRPEETIRKSIEASLCYGVYEGSRQVAFARVVTDGATMYWLCDVYVAEEYRGKGIGKRLVEAVVADDRLAGLSGFLGTKDAHGLYEAYGFRSDPEKLMRRRPEATIPTTL